MVELPGVVGWIYGRWKELAQAGGVVGRHLGDLCHFVLEMLVAL